jgi:hypothetical protein
MATSVKEKKPNLVVAPGETYHEVTTWIALSVVTEHWQSDLKFFQDELRFLRTLINKYFVWLIEEENIDKTRRLAARLTEIDHQRTSFEKELDKHLKHLHALLENPFAHDAHEIRQEHEKLEDGYANFVKDFRALKRETFKLTEHVIESEKAQHLLKGDVV